MHKFNVEDRVVVNRGIHRERIGTIVSFFQDTDLAVVNLDEVQYSYNTSWLDPAPVANEFVLSRSRSDEKGVAVSGVDANLFFYDVDDATKKLAIYESCARAAKAGLRFLTDNPPDPKEDKLKALEDKIKSQPNTRALAEMIYEMTKEDNND